MLEKLDFARRIGVQSVQLMFLSLFSDNKNWTSGCPIDVQYVQSTQPIDSARCEENPLLCCKNVLTIVEHCIQS